MKGYQPGLVKCKENVEKAETHSMNLELGMVLKECSCIKGQCKKKQTS